MPLNNCCRQLFNLFNDDEEWYENSTVAQEAGVKFTVNLRSDAETVCKLKVDGGLIPGNNQQRKCDYIFYRCLNKEIYFIELKASKLSDAFEQIVNTIAFLKANYKNVKIEQPGIYGCIAKRSRVPSFEIRRLQEKFKKNHGKRLEVRNMITF